MGDSSDRAREDFFSEAQEIIEGLGRDLLALDEAQRNSREDPDLINDIFRAVHTLKGLAGLFGANRMATLSHELESLLDGLRLGKVELTARVLDVLFRSVELYGRILQVEKDGKDQPMPEVEDLIRELHGGIGAGAAPAPAGQYDLDPNLLAVLTEYEEHRLRTNIQQGLTLYRLRVQFQLATIDHALDELKATAKPHGEIITYLPTGAGADADSIELDILMASKLAAGDLRKLLSGNGIELEEIARRAGAQQDPSLLPSIAPPPMPTPSVSVPRRGSVDASSMISIPIAPRIDDVHPSTPPRANEPIGSIRSVAQTVRVDIHKLDRLMNIVGELAIVRTTLSRLVERLRATHGDRELATDLHRLQRGFDRHLGAMQQGILEVRMVPLGQVFDKLARVVRQISREADKQVNLVITGAETEVDKLIVEELSDPLMHMMRNAIDHGIEARAAREAVGKPAIGTIALNAFQKGNHVVLEIEDDGAGIDTDGLLEAAIRKGILPPEDARSTSRREVLNLIFVPGVTTKSEVTDLSGRGVGMDVVKTNISKLGGVIDLQSETGIGTKVTVTLPITLAIISALIVDVGDRRFAIPLSNVQEAVVLDPAEIRLIEGREVITLRGATLQLCRLARLFELEGSDEPDQEGPQPRPTESTPPSWSADKRSPAGGVDRHVRSTLGATGASRGRSGRRRRYIVVTSVGTRRLGLVVDALHGEQDVVIKALGASLKNVRGFAGATELGDQRVGLVLDTPALVEEMLAGTERVRLEQERGTRG